MVEPRRYDIDEVVAITVTFQPNIELLRRQVEALHRLSHVVWVDNGSETASVEALRDLASRYATVRLIESGSNNGLAAGLNRGIRHAIECVPSCKALLLLDQDSTFEDEAPEALLSALGEVEADTGVPCCVGPSLRDPDTGMVHGFHYVEKGWKWARGFPSTTSRTPFAVDNLNGSGTTMSLALAQRVGLLDESFFIDHVDTDWAFRVKSLGFGLFGIPWVSFDHRMGEKGRRVWFLGWRVWPDRSPQRHRYLFRNTLRLMKRPYVPVVWKVWAVGKLGVTMIVVAASDPRRSVQLRMMFKGLREGWNA